MNFNNYLFRDVFDHWDGGLVLVQEVLDLVDESLMVVLVWRLWSLVLNLLQVCQLHHLVQVRARLKPIVRAVTKGGQVGDEPVGEEKMEVVTSQK